MTRYRQVAHHPYDHIQAGSTLHKIKHLPEPDLYKRRCWSIRKKINQKIGRMVEIQNCTKGAVTKEKSLKILMGKLIQDLDKKVTKSIQGSF